MKSGEDNSLDQYADMDETDRMHELLKDQLRMKVHTENTNKADEHNKFFVHETKMRKLLTNLVEPHAKRSK